MKADELVYGDLIRLRSGDKVPPSSCVPCATFDSFCFVVVFGVLPESVIFDTISVCGPLFEMRFAVMCCTSI